MDECKMAAFLAGTCDREERAEMIRILVQHPSTREVLCMAQEALEAAQLRPRSVRIPTARQ
ncbi:MAG: hypothetical protein ACE5G0_08750 [Rhodothermales bacterium]